ncbi:hypothetical protein WG908_11750 [Sphingobium sp. AN641]|uniref:hypothetical protein n=1 Tax=Sphingobium sp. AN641 TaxID=3133443 RepID=UPI0030BD5ABD
MSACLSSDRSDVRHARRAWLEAQQRREAEDRREWLDHQQRIRDQEREQWLASQQSNTRQAAPDREDRLSWLFEQQQRPADRDTKDAQRDNAPDFIRHQDCGPDIER